VFSSSFGAIGIDWATGRKLQQVERDSQHASRCGKRETRLPETVATGSEPRTSLSSSARGFGSSVVQTSQQPSARAQLAAALSSDEFAVWRPCSLALGAPPTTYRSPIRGTGCSLGGGGSPHGKYRAGTRRQHPTTRLGGAPVGSVLEHIPSGRIRRLGPQALPGVLLRPRPGSEPRTSVPRMVCTVPVRGGRLCGSSATRRARRASTTRRSGGGGTSPPGGRSCT
jgi:hypothetical protein